MEKRMIYSRMDDRGRAVGVYANPGTLGGGLHFRTNPNGHDMSDDDLSDLISALQGYMSKRAREMTKGNSGR